MVQRGKLFVIRVVFITNGAASSFQVSLCLFFKTMHNRPVFHLIETIQNTNAHVNVASFRQYIQKHWKTKPPLQLQTWTNDVMEPWLLSLIHPFP